MKNLTLNIFIVITFLFSTISFESDSTSISIDFSYAFYERNLEKLKSLIENNTKINEIYCGDGKLIHRAVKEGYFDIVKLLIEMGADVNEGTDYYRETPLHLAAEKGFLEIIKLLLDNGAIINILTTIHQTPLYVAATNGRLEVVEFLLKRGAGLNDLENDWCCGNKRVLFCAAEAGFTDVVKMLLAYGAKIDNTIVLEFVFSQEICEVIKQYKLVIKLAEDKNIDLPWITAEKVKNMILNNGSTFEYDNRDLLPPLEIVVNIFKSYTLSNLLNVRLLSRFNHELVGITTQFKEIVEYSISNWKDLERLERFIKRSNINLKPSPKEHQSFCLCM